MFYLNCFEMTTRWRPTRDEIIEKNFFFCIQAKNFYQKFFSHLHISNIVLNYAFSNFYLVRTFEVDIKEQNIFKSKIFRIQKFGNFIRNRFQWFSSDRLTTRRRPTALSVSCPCLVFIGIFRKIISGVCLLSRFCPDFLFGVYRRVCLSEFCLSRFCQLSGLCPDF